MNLPQLNELVARIDAIIAESMECIAIAERFQRDTSYQLDLEPLRVTLWRMREAKKLLTGGTTMK